MTYDLMIVGGSFPMPMAGGSINYVYRLLSGIDDMSYFVFTGNSDNETNRLFDQRFGHLIIRSRFFGNVLETYHGSLLKRQFYNLIVICQIIYYILKYKPKIICNTEISLLTISLFIARLFHKFRLGVFTYAEEIQTNKGRYIHGKVIKKALIEADNIITVCDYTRNMLNSIYRVDDKITKIIPSVQTTVSKVGERDIEKNKLVVLTVARLSERKGHVDVLYALSEIINIFNNVEYRIVGIGSYENEIKKKISELKLDNYVKLLGAVSDKELEQEYNKADIFVLHHKQLSDGDTEGCPTVFLEAGMHHLPVIGGEAGGVADAIKDKITGFICHVGTNELCENLKLLLSDKNLRLEMGNNGYNYAKQFTKEKQAAIFRELINIQLKA